MANGGTEKLARLIERAMHHHAPSMTYQEALHRQTADDFDVGLLRTAEGIVKEARKSLGAKSGPTTEQHWKEAIRVARTRFIGDGA